jgi:hypothetical protein
MFHRFVTFKLWSNEWRRSRARFRYGDRNFSAFDYSKQKCEQLFVEEGRQSYEVFFMKASFWIVTGTVIAIAPFSVAQSLAGSGYRVPANSIDAAPGQALLVSVRGIKAISNLELGSAAAKAIAAEFAQGPDTANLVIQTLQQTRCAQPAAANCQPVTSMLIQMPFGLKSGSVLRIKEEGAVVGEFALRGVADAIHLLNTCDELRGGVPAAAAPVPVAACAALVGSSRGPLVTRENPARGGETLFVYA